MGPKMDAGRPNIVIPEIFWLEAEAARPDVVVGPGIIRPEVEAGRPDVAILGPEAKAVDSGPTTFGRLAPQVLSSNRTSLLAYLFTDFDFVAVILRQTLLATHPKTATVTIAVVLT